MRYRRVEKCKDKAFFRIDTVSYAGTGEITLRQRKCIVALLGFADIFSIKVDLRL